MLRENLEKLFLKLKPALIVLSTLVFFIIVFMLWKSYIFQPLSQQETQLLAADKQLKKDVNNFKLKTNLAGQELFSQKYFMRSNDVNRILKQVLDQEDKVKLVSLEKLSQKQVPVKEVFQQVFVNGLSKLEQRQYELVLEGDFTAFYRVLQLLKAYPGIFWQQTDFTIEKYPQAEITLKFAVYNEQGK